MASFMCDVIICDHGDARHGFCKGKSDGTIKNTKWIRMQNHKHA